MKYFLFVLAVFGLTAVSPATAELTIDELVQSTGIREGGVPVRDLSGWDTASKIVVFDTGIDLESQFADAGDAKIVVVSSKEEALDAVVGADAFAGWCDPDVVAAGSELKWLQLYSAGAERCVNLTRVESGQIVLTNMQKMSSPMIGEHAIAMTMALARKLPQFGRRMNDGDWAPQTSVGMQSVVGKTLLVVGLGGIGTESARLAAALGMRVVATRNSSRNGPEFVDYVGLSHELNALAGQADFIVNALPLTTSTRGLLDTAFFAAVKPGAIFVNVGRGATVDTAALVAALRSGQIAGAGLDVTDPEPLPAEHPLWGFENVIITPHVSGRGADRMRHAVLFAENLRRYLRGDRLLNVVEPERGY